MTSTTDIGNRALQILGTRSVMTSLAESSNEAIQISLALAPIQAWSFGLANWNFARATTQLTALKGPPPVTPPPWTSTYPSPPWLYEFGLPADFIRAQYITGYATATPAAGYVGEPKRFVLSVDTVSSVQQQVLLTNEVTPTLIYTANISDPTLWPWYFERLVVLALAQTTCIALTGDKKLLTEIMQLLEQQISIAIQSNLAEGLIISDSTPEWIQAVGIDYPYRRITPPTIQHHQRSTGGADDNNS